MDCRSSAWTAIPLHELRHLCTGCNTPIWTATPLHGLQHPPAWAATPLYGLQHPYTGCNTPSSAKTPLNGMQHPCTGCNTPAWIATTLPGLQSPCMSSDTPVQAATPLHGLQPHPCMAFFPRCVLNKPVTSLPGQTRPLAASGLEGAGLGGKQPSKRPRPRSGQGNWCHGGGRAPLASLRSGLRFSGRGHARL